eukprot:COSAG01_NODE_70248_length_259_cov_0.643750_1_plen_62_part_01
MPTVAAMSTVSTTKVALYLYRAQIGGCGTTTGSNGACTPLGCATLGGARTACWGNSIPPLKE